MNAEEQIKELEEEISTTKYNKATQKHIGLLKAKIARLKEAAEKRSGGGGGIGYTVRKSGDATVLLVGFPSVGKSTFLNTVTNAESKTGAYQFTTLGVIPGALDYTGAKIQILDIPGIIESAASGKGFGKKVLSTVRSADCILIMLAGDNAKSILNQLDSIQRELYDSNFRLGVNPPDIKIIKKSTGGISLQSSSLLSADEIKSIAKEFGLVNADIIIRENCDTDRFIDAIVKNRMYIPFIVGVNKSDILPAKEQAKVLKAVPDAVIFSSEKQENLESLKKALWKQLGLMRIFMKKIKKDPDMEEPLVIKKGSTVLDICKKIHQEFANKFDYARIWGPSARHPGQKIGGQQVLQEKDILELHFK